MLKKVLTPVGDGKCWLTVWYADCSGNILFWKEAETRPVACSAEGVFWTYCTPESLFTGSQGHCELVDYYGTEIVLRVCAPPHEFEAQPYPIGFVARHDPFGTFHPTTRIRWIPPPLGSREGSFPTYADSEWRLWFWGTKRKHDGSGQPPPFPCNMSGEDLLRNNVPAQTTCVRIQLWSAPAFPDEKTPTLVPGVLEYPTMGIEAVLPPGRRVALSFPYASHPATGKTVNIDIGSAEYPVFPGFFQRWWKVRLRLDEKWVEDVKDKREVCETVKDESGNPIKRCWMEEYVKEKKWNQRDVDEILLLTRLGKRYDWLHPPYGIVRTPLGVASIPLIEHEGQLWLWFPIAVREGQGAVCANPGCVGSEPQLPQGKGQLLSL